VFLSVVHVVSQFWVCLMLIIFILQCLLSYSDKSKLKMEGTVFTPCLEGMKHVKSDQGEMLTKPFLELCKTILPVIGNKRRSFF